MVSLIKTCLIQKLTAFNCKFRKIEQIIPI